MQDTESRYDCSDHDGKQRDEECTNQRDRVRITLSSTSFLSRGSALQDTRVGMLDEGT